MRRILTLCLLLLSAAGLTGVAYADAMVGPVEFISQAIRYELPVVLVVLVMIVTFIILWRIGRKK